MSADHSQKIAKSFSRLGWIGLWIQAVLAILPVAMLLYVLFGMTTGSRETLGFIDYLAFVGVAILGFTALWSYRYTRLGRRIADPRAPADSCRSCPEMVATPSGRPRRRHPRAAADRVGTDGQQSLHLPK